MGSREKLPKQQLTLSWASVLSELASTGVQKQSPQNVPLWYDYFELKATETLPALEKFLPLSVNYLAESKLGALPIVGRHYHQKYLFTTCL